MPSKRVVKREAGEKSAAILKVARKSIQIRKTRKSSTKIATQLVSPVPAADMENDQTSLPLKKSYVSKAVKKLYILSGKESEKKELFDEDKPIYLQISTVKIPKCPSAVMTFKMEHSIWPHDSEILLITPDFAQGEKDYDKNIEHYKELLESHKIMCVKDILPLHKLKAQYREYEMQYRLAGLYDVFLCDSSIKSRVMQAVGHVLSKRNKQVIGLKLKVPKLKKVFENTLNQTQIAIHSHGDNYSLPIGHTGMIADHLVDNIMAAAIELNKRLPGGFTNIKGLHIKTSGGKAIQFYLSAVPSKAVTVPAVPKKKKGAAIAGELLTQDEEANVIVTASGDVLLKQTEVAENVGEKPATKRNRKSKVKLNKGSIINKETEENQLMIGNMPKKPLKRNQKPALPAIQTKKTKKVCQK